MECDKVGGRELQGNEVQGKEGRTIRAGHPDCCVAAFPGFWVLVCLAVVLTLGPLGGCQSGPENPGMADAYFLDESKDLGALGRVSLVELENMSSYPQIATEMTEALYLEAQKQQLFGLTVVPQDYPAWRSLQENLDSLQAMRQLAVLRDTLRSNGLLVGTITQYQPYPHMVIGLRLKLLDLTDGQLLWGLEQVWDSTDKSVRKRIQKYFNQQLSSGHAPLNEELVTVSSRNFCKFVAYEVAATLRPPKDR